MTERRSVARHLVVLGGLLGIAATPVATRLTDRVRRRVRQAAHGGDPVAAFREAPCYRSPDGWVADEESRAEASS